MNEGAALLAVDAEIEELLSLNQPEILGKRHSYFRVPGTVPESYEERFFELGSERLILAGICHFNGEKEQPFVHVLLGFEPNLKELEALKEFSQRQFHLFRPKLVSFSLRPSSPMAILLEERGVAAQRYFAGKIAEISRRTRPASCERVTGLIGARHESLLGSPAIYMTEFLLTGSFKGRGFAAGVQRKFLDSVNQDFQLIWGRRKL